MGCNSIGYILPEIMSPTQDGCQFFPYPKHVHNMLRLIKWPQRCQLRTLNFWAFLTDKQFELKKVSRLRIFALKKEEMMTAS